MRTRRTTDEPAPVLGPVGFVVGVPEGAVGEGPAGTFDVAVPGVVL